jgi:hypothetical protein
VYDLAYQSETLRVIIHATGLEENRNFVFSWQLYGIIGNRTTFGPIHHVGGAADPFTGTIDLETVVGENEYNTTTFPNSSGIAMNQAPADQRGCYWVMATISDKTTHTNEVMTSNVSKFVSYGQPCPTEDQDGDGWSDVQEQQFNSDPSDPESNPHSMYGNLNESYGNLNESYGNLNESYGNLNESYGNLNESYGNLNESYENLSLLYSDCQGNDRQNQIEWDATNDSLAVCQDDLVNATGNTPCPTCKGGESDSISITGGGDAADLIVVGGAAILAGIGLSSIFNQSGGGRLDDGGGKKPDIDIDIDDVGDVFDDLDVDLDIRPDLDLDKPRTEKKSQSTTDGSDQYFKSGVERQKVMTDSADPLLDDYVEDDV